MTIADTLTSFDKKTISLAKKLGKASSLLSLKEIEPGEWDAVVKDRDEYDVFVTLTDEQVERYMCSCTEEENRPCAHLALVLQTLQTPRSQLPIELPEETKPVKKEPRTKKLKPGSVEEILSRVSHAELQTFVIGQTKKNKPFKAALSIAFVQQSGTTDFLKTYIEIIQQLIKANIRIKRKEVEYNSAKKFATQINQLIKKASQLILKGEYPEAHSIARAIIETLRAFEKKSGYVVFSDLIEAAFQTLNTVLNNAPPPVKNQVIDYLFDLIPITDDTYLFTENTFDILQTHLYTTQQEERFIALIDTKIKWLKANNNYEYTIIPILTKKIKFLQAHRRNNEVKNVILENIHYREMRLLAIQEAIQQKEFDKARLFIFKGIDQERKHNHLHYEREYRTLLLQIEQTTGNTPEVLKIAEQLFEQTRYDINFYRIIKENYPPDKWPQKRDELLQKVSRIESNERYRHSFNEINILAEEQMWDKIVQLAIKYQEHEFPLNTYLDTLKVRYPKEMIQIFHATILRASKYSKLENYYTMVRLFKKLVTIEGGEPVARQLLRQLILLHKTRYTMIELFSVELHQYVEAISM